MNANIFEIDNLVCAYEGTNKDVLSIDQLAIERGNIVFILGASGSGKSTLLETLGLMNDTAKSGSIKLNTADEEVVQLSEIWDQSISERINLRKKEYGFIFQNTNLMDNLSAEENIILSGLIKEDKTYHDFVSDTHFLLNKIGLSGEGFNPDSLPSNLSGGQRQRLAFARALISKCNIVFGDEPTGNLDVSTAYQLMDFLKQEVKSQNKTALIVSHDINLSLKFADKVIVITKNKETGVGEILQENILYKDDWQDKEDEYHAKILDLYRTYQTDIDESIIHEEKAESNKKFSKLYFEKEYQSLLGKKKLNLWLLCIIFLVTFMTIGLANGSLRYLDVKLNSAFVNWVNITVPGIRASESNVIEKLNNNWDLKQQYLYSKVTPYSKDFLYIKNNENDNYSLRSGRSINPPKDKEIIENDILEDKNLVNGLNTNFNGEQDLSLIVTSRLLEELGYDPQNTSQIFIKYKHYLDEAKTKQEMFQIPISIRAVVKDIPGKNDFLCTEYFLKAWNQNNRNAFDISKKTKDLRINIVGLEGAELNEVRQKVKTLMEGDDTLQKYDPLTDPFSPNESGMKLGENLIIDFEKPLPNKDVLDSLFEKICRMDELKKAKQVNRIYYYGYVNEDFRQTNWDYYSIYFNELDSIRAFSDYIYDNFNEPNEAKIELDITKVKDKENFNFMSGITKIISLFLILLGLISSALLIFNVLKLHFNKIKANIGTLNAIGLNYQITNKLYLLIVLKFVVTALAIAFAFAFLSGFVFDTIISKVITMEADMSYYTLFHYRTFLFTIITILATVFVSWYSIKKYLIKTPGDLIYNR